jgi:hypothetical protein
MSIKGMQMSVRSTVFGHCICNLLTPSDPAVRPLDLPRQCVDTGNDLV